MVSFWGLAAFIRFDGSWFQSGAIYLKKVTYVWVVHFLVYYKTYILNTAGFENTGKSQFQFKQLQYQCLTNYCSTHYQFILSEENYKKTTAIQSHIILTSFSQIRSFYYNFIGFLSVGKMRAQFWDFLFDWTLFHSHLTVTKFLNLWNINPEI